MACFSFSPHVSDESLFFYSLICAVTCRTSQTSGRRNRGARDYAPDAEQEVFIR